MWRIRGRRSPRTSSYPPHRPRPPSAAVHSSSWPAVCPSTPLTILAQPPASRHLDPASSFAPAVLPATLLACRRGRYAVSFLGTHRHSASPARHRPPIIHPSSVHVLVHLPHPLSFSLAFATHPFLLFLLRCPSSFVDGWSASIPSLFAGIVASPSSFVLVREQPIFLVGREGHSDGASP
ncbi:hypothetical protein BDN70DRAFT_940009 [Pholiota conissans]|uniref:Uncharacterized protein n=1 Tax=Pholiota conissans TaxID=109636 RepID=A0A9P5YK95_9AGAR|nr:hypothetical protein BDN70DRAFT_940009 [Pholiota conissans]